jgi:hypothetical protein
MYSSVLTVAGGLAVEEDTADSFLVERAGEEGVVGVLGGLPVECELPERLRRWLEPADSGWGSEEVDGWRATGQPLVC